MNPLISIIMPAYHCTETLENSVRSALSQTFRAIEVIVVNDSPEDGSTEILNRLTQEDARVRVIPVPEDIGVAEARNRGVGVSNGEWIAFLDCDDQWEPDKLEKQLKAADETGAALLYTAAACIDAADRKTGKVFSVPLTITADVLLHSTDIVTSTVLVRRDVYLRHPMERSDLHEDFICWYGILREGVKAVGINEPLVRYRISGGSKSGNKWRSAWMTWKSYGHLGIPFLPRVRCFLGYCLHGIKRYWL